MSLRHRIPDFSPSLDRLTDDGKVVPRLAAPTKVEFRSKANLDGVVDAIRAKKCVHVDAAVGAGKSSVLPSLVATRMGCLVLQVFPNEYLAADIAAYCKSKGDNVEYMGSADDDLPEDGVVCLTASNLVARWLSAGEALLKKCVVFHDESHESDCYTYIVKSLAPTIGGVLSYVTATATASGAGFRPMETDGKVVDKVVPAEVFNSDWDVYSSAPWGVETLEGHMLIFQDVKKKAEALAVEYRMAGMDVYRFHSRMPMNEFEFAMKKLRDPNSPLMVIIADNSFRSGFTFPVSRIVDTALLLNVVVEEGKPIFKLRSVYEMEAYQARGRGGRLKGQVTTYYRPDVQLPSMICDLELADMDAVALIFRLLGYVVPRQLAGMPMATGKVPRMLKQSLNSSTPLACLMPTQLQEIDDFFTPGGRRSPYLKEGYEFSSRPLDFVNKAVSADVARARGMGGIQRTKPIPDIINEWENQQEDRMLTREEYVRSPSAVPKPLGRKDYDQYAEYDHHDSMRRVADAVRSMTMYEDPVEHLEVGKYYYATGLYTSAAYSGTFPDGVESVCKMLSRDKTESIHLGLSSYDRSVALNALLMRYNVRTCEVRVLSRSIPEAKHRAVSKDLSALRKWATDMTEAMLTANAELAVIGKYLVRLARDYCGMAEMPPMLESEESGHAAVMAQVGALPDAVIGAPDAFVQGVRNQWETYSGIPALSYESGSSDSGSNDLSRVVMPTQGRGMRALPHVSAGYGPGIGSKGGTKEFSIRKSSGGTISLVRR